MVVSIIKLERRRIIVGVINLLFLGRYSNLSQITPLIWLASANHVYLSMEPCIGRLQMKIHSDPEY
jgi:hypothetical protein